MCCLFSFAACVRRVRLVGPEQRSAAANGAPRGNSGPVHPRPPPNRDAGLEDATVAEKNSNSMHLHAPPQLLGSAAGLRRRRASYSPRALPEQQQRQTAADHRRTHTRICKHTAAYHACIGQYIHVGHLPLFECAASLAAVALVQPFAHFSLATPLRSAHRVTAALNSLRLHNAYTHFQHCPLQHCWLRRSRSWLQRSPRRPRSRRRCFPLLRTSPRRPLPHSSRTRQTSGRARNSCRRMDHSPQTQSHTIVMRMGAKWTHHKLPLPLPPHLDPTRRPLLGRRASLKSSREAA